MAKTGEQVSLQEANLQYLIEEAERQALSARTPAGEAAPKPSKRRVVAPGEVMK